ncbi:MAG: DUF4118 domain-containing protein, partial [Terriglobia bacterium]
MSGFVQKPFSGIVWDVGIPLGAIAAATAVTYLFAGALGPKVPVATFCFLLAVVGSAARGYKSGILACLLIFLALPLVFTPPRRAGGPAPGRIALTFMIALLVSAVASTRRRAEKSLQLSNEGLDRRVKERTSALEKANAELAQREEELNLTKSHLNEVLDSVSESFLALDRDWRFTYANKQILTTLGRSTEDV